MERLGTLVLGGSTEASDLARLLAGDARFGATLSLAGVTRSPRPQPIPCRSGGFGGVDGLVGYLRRQRVRLVVNATHPFAAQMTRHAAQAAAQAGIPLLRVLRPPWAMTGGDRWTAVPDMAAAAQSLGAVPRRVLLTIGQKDLASFAAQRHHCYLIRSVDPPDPATLPPDATILTATGPFRLDDELRLLRDHAIGVLVTKNAGGRATAAKLEAARILGLPVVMVARPSDPAGDSVPDAAAALRWLDAHHAATLRGV